MLNHAISSIVHVSFSLTTSLGKSSLRPALAVLTVCTAVGVFATARADDRIGNVFERSAGATAIPVQFQDETEPKPRAQPGPDAGGPPAAQRGATPAEKPTGKPYEQAFEGGFPKTPKRRAVVLSNLYAYLATAPDAPTAKEIAAVIERLWLMSGSDTISVLMERSMQAVAAKRTDLAMELLDAVVELAPDYAEGWNRRAFVNFLRDNPTGAAGDLRRVLALDPNHFKAMQGLAQILKDADQSKGALKAFRKLVEIHPFAEGAEDAIRELEIETEGQGI